MSPRRHVAIALASIFLGVPLLLEAGLQFAAWVVWRRSQRATAPAALGGESVVLCVGDSFTYGLGATSPAFSYPATLEARLHGSGMEGWRVVNAGWPGQNSRDVLRRLGRQLEESRPRFVYVLIGTNDQWSRPALVTPSDGIPFEAKDAFRWTWRTGRLLALVRSRWRGERLEGGEASADSPPPLVGEWRWRDLRVEFAPGGVLRIQGVEGEWSLEESRLTVRLPEGDGLEMPWRIDADRLVLLPLRGGAPLVLEAAAASPALDRPEGEGISLSEAWDALRAGDLDRALIGFRTCVANSPEDPWPRQGLVVALRRLGRQDEVGDHVSWLRTRYLETEDPVVGETFASALAASGERDESLRFARELVARFPESARAWEVIARQGTLAGEWDLAHEAVEAALRLPAAGEPGLRARLLRLRAEVLAREDPEEEIECRLRAFLLDGDEALTLNDLRFRKAEFTRDRFERCLVALAPGPEDRARLERVFRKVAAGEGEVPGVLEAHLRRIVATCRARGAEAVLLSYPWPHPELEPVFRRVTSETRAGFVDVRRAFDSIFREGRRDEFFVPDGHPNDRGYEVVAGLVADDLLRRAGPFRTSTGR